MKYKFTSEPAIYDLPNPKSWEWLEAFYPGFTGSRSITEIEDLAQLAIMPGN